MLRVLRADPKGHAVIVDVRGSAPLAAFKDVGDPTLAAWWSGASAIVFPDREFLPVLKGASVPGMRLCIHRDAFRQAVTALIPRCARRMTGLAGAPSERDIDLLAKPIGSLSDGEEAMLAPSCGPGSLGHGFLLRHHSIMRTHDAGSLAEARSRLERWMQGCIGQWSRIFAPVVEFLRSHENELLAHAVALAAWPPTRLPPTSEPAALYTLRLSRADAKRNAPEMPDPSPSLSYRPSREARLTPRRIGVIPK
jgi:hypothetical protein